jgi:subtilisin family serine protease
MQGDFVEASYAPQTFVEVLVESGCAADARQFLSSLGAQARFVDDKLGYFLVTLPGERILSVLDMPGLTGAYAEHRPPFAWDLDSFIVRDEAFISPSDRKPAAVPAIEIPYPQVGRTLPPNQPYFTAAEAGLVALWKDHPRADGRGVKVAVLDLGLDLLHPALKVAKDLEGRDVPKVVDILAASPPEESSGWVKFGEPLRARNGDFVSAGRVWKLPGDGVYSFGVFSRSFDLGSKNPTDSNGHRVSTLSLSVGVLWDEQRNRIWVDTDGDGDFRNQRALGDYATTHDIDWFGKQQGEDDNRIPFGVKIDRARRAAYLSIAIGMHGGYIAGSLAANRRTGGLYDGAAPNVQLIDVPYPPFMPALLGAFARADVDLINWSGGYALPVPFPGLPVWYNALVDFGRIIGERAIAVYDKPIVCVCGLAGGISVGIYDSPESLRRNQQRPPPYSESVDGWIWFTEDGMQNAVAAPAGSLNTQSRYIPKKIGQNGAGHAVDGREVYDAPAGYSLDETASATIPIVSGVLADLISAAKREHIRYNARRLQQAVFAGARWLPGFAGEEQDYGVLNAQGAWRQLVSMAQADDPHNNQLTSFTVARMENGHPVPINGFHADMPQGGGEIRADLWITRHGGYARARAYTLNVRGNEEGIYEIVEPNLALTREEPVRVPLKVHLLPGRHLSFLELKDTQAGIAMQVIPLDVRVLQAPAVIAPWTWAYRQTLLPGHAFRFLYVRPDNSTQALRYTLRIPEGCDVLGWPHDHRPDIPHVGGPAVDAAHHVGPMRTIQQVSLNDEPEPETEAIGLRIGQGADRPDIPVEAQLRVEGFAVELAKLDGEHLRVSNRQAPIQGRVEFYRASLSSMTLQGGDSHDTAELTRTLPAGLSQWRILVSPPSTNAAADAYLINCTHTAGTPCRLVEQKSISAPCARFVINDPQGGDWKLLVREPIASGVTGEYRVREAQLIPAEEQSDLEASHASGARWQVKIPAATDNKALYAAYQISGKPYLVFGEDGKEQHMPGNVWEQKLETTVYRPKQSDLRIAMTPLAADAP